MSTNYTVFDINQTTAFDINQINYIYLCARQYIIEMTKGEIITELDRYTGAYKTDRNMNATIENNNDSLFAYMWTVPYITFSPLDSTNDSVYVIVDTTFEDNKKERLLQLVTQDKIDDMLLNVIDIMKSKQGYVYDETDSTHVCVMKNDCASKTAVAIYLFLFASEEQIDNANNAIIEQNNAHAKEKTMGANQP